MKNGGYLYSGPFPAGLTVFSTVRKLIKTEPLPSPTTIITEREKSDEIIDLSKVDKSALSLITIRSLLSLYDDKILPLYPYSKSSVDVETETSFKHLKSPDKLIVLIKCAIAAAYKSYKRSDWKAVAKLCRDWADELAAAVIAERDHAAVEALLLLSIYELVDPERCIIWDLLNFAKRICLENGWHRLNYYSPYDTNGQQDATQYLPPFPESCTMDQLTSLTNLLYNIEKQESPR